MTKRLSEEVTGDAMPDKLDQIKSQFDVSDLRPGQERALCAAVEGRNVFGVMPTGGGKSLCYQGPAALDYREKGATLVVTPLIALMRDQVKSMMALGIPAIEFHSQVSQTTRGLALHGMREHEQALVYTSPEQLARGLLLDGTEGVDFARLVVDEAHCISMWGRDFRPDYLRIKEFADRRGIDQIMAFTATAAADVRKDIVSSLGLGDHEFVEISPFRENLSYSVEKISGFNGKMLRLARIVPRVQGGPVLVYCAKRRNCEKAQESFAKTMPWKKSEFYHAGLNGGERQDIEERFLSDEIDVLFTTNAFGMGVDKPNIRAVVHFDVPGNVGNYVQETGRAGRDGEAASCVLLYDEKDLKTQRNFNERKLLSGGFVWAVYERLKEIAAREQDGWQEFIMEYLCYGAMGNVPVWMKGNGGQRSQRGSVNSALHLLVGMGAIELYGDKVRFLDDLSEKGVVEGVVANIADIRGGVSETLLGRMVEYAETRGGGQEKLIELLEMVAA